MEGVSCPNCSGSKTLPGQLYYGESQGVVFCPAGIRGFLGVPVFSGFCCCLDCGHVWSRLAPDQLEGLIGAHGTELAKQYLKTVHLGPFHDLPDHPAAREAALKAAEIDELVVKGRDGAATRRYRELTGKTWDQSIAQIGRWRHLVRTAKLALFGWSPKRKADKEDRTQAHPMGDRWLDG